jgi:hypothetical protein
MVKIENKNVFISSSCIFANDETVYEDSIRFIQLLDTIKSCENVDDHINIIAEGSNLTKHMRDTLNNNAILFELSSPEVDKYVVHKQTGTMTLYAEALDKIEVNPDANLFFLSGRYRLLEGFNVENFKGDYVYKKHWWAPIRGGWYGTQLFKISGHKKEEFKIALLNARNLFITGKAQDFECGIYQALNEIGAEVVEVDAVFCGGLLGNSGNFEIH